jgi:hypothetical protein
LTLVPHGAILLLSDLQLMQRFLEMNPSPFYGDCRSIRIRLAVGWRKGSFAVFYRNGCSGRRTFQLFLF